MHRFTISPSCASSGGTSAVVRDAYAARPSPPGVACDGPGCSPLDLVADPVAVLNVQHVVPAVAAVLGEMPPASAVDGPDVRGHLKRVDASPALHDPAQADARGRVREGPVVTGAAQHEDVADVVRDGASGPVNAP